MDESILLEIEDVKPNDDGSITVIVTLGGDED